MAGRIIARAEPLYVIAIAPLLLFPTFRPAWTLVALAGLVVVWVAASIARREAWPATPFNAALLVFCLAVPLAVWASPVPELTLPKLAGLILGLAAFRAVASEARERRGLMIALAVLGAAGLAIWGMGALGMRLPALEPVTRRLPAALVSLPGAEQGINPNQLAGALVFLLPLLAGCAAGSWQTGKRGAAIVLALVGLAGLVTLAYTGSRSGWVGIGVAAGALALGAAWLAADRQRRRILLAVVLLVLVAGTAAGAMIAQRAVASGVTARAVASQGDAVLQQLTLDARIEIWSRAVYALQDFPVTGVGLGAFRRVVNVLYPLFLVPPDADIAHSHNMFLQVGVDLGLIGLTGYVSLLLVAVAAGWQVAAARAGFERFVALGALAALMGLHVYGLADALALGSKPSIVFWVVLGIIAGMRETPS